MREIITDIIKALEVFIDQKRIEFAKKSYPTSMKVLGVTVPNQKIVLKELKAKTKHLTGREKLELAKKLVNTNIFECQYIALEYIGKDKKALSELNENDLDEFLINMDNWISVDCYSLYLVGYTWQQNKITTEKIKTYLKSDDFWTRRIAVAATVSLNQKARGGVGDAKRTLEICALAVNDHQDMINKALSWALRELAPIDKDSVINFINKYENNLHSRVIREVKNKIEKDYKN